MGSRQTHIPKEKRIVTIYSLKHPITKCIFYIGRTTMGLNDRLYAFYKTYSSPRLKNVLDEILTCGKRPIIEPVDTTEYNLRKEVEEYWIQQFSAWGFNLVNTKHVVNKNYIPAHQKPKWNTKLSEYEISLVNLLYTVGDGEALGRICNISGERIRQIIKHRRYPAAYKDKIIEYFINKARTIINSYNELAA